MDVKGNQKHNSLSYVFFSMLIFVIFMGVNFLKVNINGVNINLAKIIMVLTSIPLFLIVRKIGLEEIIKNKDVKIIIIFLLIWMTSSLVSLYKMKNVIMWIITNFFIVFGTATIVYIIAKVQRIEQIINIFKIIELTLIINSIYSIVLYLTGCLVYGGFYYNVNDMSTLYLIGIPIEIMLTYNRKNDKLKLIASIILLIINLISFTILDSRACELGVLLGSGFIAFLIFYIKVLNNKNVIIKCLAILLIIMMSILVIYPMVSKLNIKPRIENSRLNSIGIRINLIYNGLFFLSKNPVLGIGTGNMEYYMQNSALFNTKNVYNMHNYWMEILVDYGLVIFIPFIYFYYRILKLMILEYIKTNEKLKKEILLTFIFFMVAFLIGSISSSNNITKEWLWLLAGIILAFINVSIKKKKEKIND